MILVNNDIWLYKLRKEIIKRLLEEGYEVYISVPNGEYVQTLVEWGCKFVETEVDRRGKNPLNDLSLFIHYIKILRKFKPDVILAYTIKPNLYGSLAGRILNIPYINNITGLGSGFIKESLMKRTLTILYKISLKNSYCVFFQNDSDRKLFESEKIVHDNNSELIPGSGVNLKEYKFKNFPEEGKITFNFIGRIMKDKGIDEYLECAKQIKENYPNTQFNVLGFVEKTQFHYQEILNNYHDKGYINYLGFQTDVKPFIEDSHCLIQPSHGGEGISNVLLESGALGRVLIASNIPGCRETIVYGENGYTFNAKDSGSLVEKIEMFINLPLDIKEKMGKNSRELIEREFNRDFVVSAYINKISQLIN